jgi:hypothetical protein
MQRRGSGVGERYAALKPPRGDQLEKRRNLARDWSNFRSQIATLR